MRIYQKALLPFANLLSLHRVSAEATPRNVTFGSVSNPQHFGLNMGEVNATRKAPVIAISHGGGPRKYTYYFSNSWLTSASAPPGRSRPRPNHEVAPEKGTADSQARYI